MKIMKLAIYTALVIAFGTFQSIAGTMSFSIVDLGTKVTPTAINNKGQVVGYSITDDGHIHAFLYENQILTDLGTFGGTDSEALAINGSGHIVGNYFKYGYKHAFLLYNSQFTDMFGLAGMIEATGINDQNVMIGDIVSTPDMGSTHVILYDNGLVTDISVLGEIQGVTYPFISASPRGINNKGQAIFFQGLCGSWECEHSYVFSGETVSEIFPFNATDINDLGQVVGSSMREWGQVDSYLYNQGDLTRINDFGGNYSYPTALNNVGQVIGTAQYSQDYKFHPFIYFNETMKDLNTLIPADSGWDITKVSDINDKGQIIGTGLLNGEQHAFVLSPLVQTVQIDIRPSDADNEINLRANGKLTVVIFSSTMFDATAINPESVILSGAGIAKVGKGDKYLYDLEDINGDGLIDLICHVYVDQLEVTPDVLLQILELDAETFGGQKVRGEDKVSLVSGQNQH